MMKSFIANSFLVGFFLHSHALSVREPHSSCQTDLSFHTRPINTVATDKKSPRLPKNQTKDARDAPFWLADIKHQGATPYSESQSYSVFRNVKDYGAVGDGIHDDTAAMNSAMNSSARCAPGVCDSSTNTPAIVYIPGGTYLIRGSTVDFYFTQIIGNPNDLPIIKASADFRSLALIEGDMYQPGTKETNYQRVLGYRAVNIFYRQIRNLILDTTAVPANISVACIHWPTSQATSLEKLEFRMTDSPGTQHQGLSIESGKYLMKRQPPDLLIS